MEELTGEKPRVQSISLQVPESVNLVEMSSKEIAELALEISRKAASSLPGKSELLGINQVTLTNSAKPDVEVWGAWSRACARPELSREGLVINPEAFRSPVLETAVKAKGVKTVIQKQ